MKNTKGKQPGQFGIVKVLIGIALVLAVVILAAEGRQARLPEETESTQSTQPQIDPLPTLAAGDRLRRMTRAEMAMGDLVLVNGRHEYDDALVTVAPLDEDREEPILIQRHILDILEDMASDVPYGARVELGYLSVEDQQGLYVQSVEDQAHADACAAIPGHSEHHTGLAADLDLGEKGTAWLAENAWKYGFIQRYPESKAQLTGIDQASGHFRYVGRPHARVMADNDLCLEEYMEFLKGYPYEGRHLTAEQDGVSYEIYYCEGLEVPVPEHGNYTISGNNTDGFIVTVEKETEQ